MSCSHTIKFGIDRSLSVAGQSGARASDERNELLTKSLIHTLRTALWHWRKGGFSQLSTWQRRRSIIQGATEPSARIASSSLSDEVLNDLFPPQPIPDRAPVFEECRVGVILDEFSAQSFGYEWSTTELTRDGWASQLDRLDFVFVESAWNGSSGDWKFKLIGRSGPSPEIVELLEECRYRGVPTVFWNKEDPPHFEDFLPLAKLCDIVFTTDSLLLDDYRRELGHERVGVLPFAAQPAIHSPARPAKSAAVRDIAFAGMYFAKKFPERRQQMDLLLGAAAKVSARMDYGLEIFSRFLGDDVRYQFPDYLANHVIGSLPYRNLLTAYKHYKVFLNVNSVVGSPSMCARRIFEITAAGTPVVTTPSVATKEFFPTDEVPQPESQKDAEYVLRAFVRSRELRDRTVHKAQRRIWSKHTYTHRALTVMNSLHIDQGNPLQHSISAVVSTNRPQHLGAIIDTHAKQLHADRELVVVAHGFELPRGFAARAAESGIDNLKVIHVDAAEPLGTCLNRGVSVAEGTIVTKMDDDDIYGAHYLSDQLAALRYSNAELVGKQAHYLHLRGRDIVMCRFPEREHRYTDLVMGPTMMGRRELFVEHPFAERTQGEDTELQHRLVVAGARIYSTDRFNFVQVRSDHAHTWSVYDDHLLANSEVHSFGFAAGHYCF